MAHVRSLQQMTVEQLKEQSPVKSQQQVEASVGLQRKQWKDLTTESSKIRSCIASKLLKREIEIFIQSADYLIFQNKNMMKMLFAYKIVWILQFLSCGYAKLWVSLQARNTHPISDKQPLPAYRSLTLLMLKQKNRHLRGAGGGSDDIFYSNWHYSNPLRHSCRRSLHW